MRSRRSVVLILVAAVSLVSEGRPSSADWLPDGVTLCNAPGYRYFVEAVSDDSGGVIATWEDHRSGANIYAGRVNAEGVSPWDTTGVAVCTAAGGQAFPTIAPDGTGGAIIAWLDHRPGGGGIFAQRIDAGGLPQWTPNGVALCSTGSPVYEPTIVSDGAGGAIVAWTDARQGDYEEDIYAQRVDAAGVPQWTPNGVPVCSASGRQDAPAMTSAGEAGVIVTWNDASAFVQLVNPDGVTQWTLNGVALGPSYTGFSGGSCTIVPDGLGGAIVCWKNAEMIYAGRVSAMGVPQWGQDGVPLVSNTSFKYRLVSVSDGGGGAIVAWANDAILGMNINAARVDALGVSRWSPNGVAICAALGYQDFPAIAADGAGGAIITWDDGERVHPYAQRVSGAGVPQWETDGAQLSTRQGYDGVVVSDGSAGAIVIWRGPGSATGDGIYASRVFGATTAVALALLSAEADAGGVRIRWHASGDPIASTSVYRRTLESDWELLGHPEPDASSTILFEDRAIAPGTRYGYRLVVRDLVGAETSAEAWVSVPQGLDAPSVPRLAPARPNPFGGQGQLSYRLPYRASVRLAVYDLQGRLVRTLVDLVEDAGWRSATWDGRDDAGRLAPSGIYFVRMDALGTVNLQKVVVAR